MKQSVINFVKEILPEVLVEYVRALRKKRRIQSRFEINQGKDVLVDIKIAEKSFSIYINPYLNGGVDDGIYRSGEWEPEISNLIRKYLSPGDTFIDIGANIGYHTLHAATLVGDSGKVVAFEPLPRLSEQMTRSIKENNFSNITVFDLALSDKIGFINSGCGA